MRLIIHETLEVPRDRRRSTAFLIIKTGIETGIRMDLSDVRKVASLSRLALSDEELAASGKQLSVILDYVRLLDEVDTTDVEPMPHPVPAENVFRTDEVRPSLPREAALSNAPKTDGQFFLVPKILEEK